MIGQEADLAQVRLDLHPIRARRNGDFQPGVTAGSHQIDRAGKRREPSRDKFEVDFVSALLRLREVDRELLQYRDTADTAVFAGGNKRNEILRLNLEPFLAKHAEGGLVDERLRIGQNAVHVEDNGSNSSGGIDGLAMSTTGGPRSAVGSLPRHDRRGCSVRPPSPRSCERLSRCGRKPAR